MSRLSQDSIKNSAQNNGFTIVELLIVVVIIAILAAITIISYTGISNRAAVSTLQSELSQAVKKVEAAKAISTTSTYPADLAAAGVNDPESKFTYGFDPLTNGYCLQAKKNNNVFYSTNVDTTMQTGECINSTVGMVGWWKFNNNTTDSSSNGLVGTATNLTPITGQSGGANTAYSFDGTTSNLAVPYTAAFSTNVQTVSAWVYQTTNTPNILYVSKRTAAGNGWMLSYLGSTNGFSFDCGGSGARYNTNYVPTLNVWTHFVATCTTGGLISMYANGTKLGTLNVSTAGLPTSNGSLYIGRDSSSAQYYHSGRLDDVRLYSRVLTDAEVVSLYNAGAQ